MSHAGDAPGGGAASPVPCAGDAAPPPGHPAAPGPDGSADSFGFDDSCNACNSCNSYDSYDETCGRNVRCAGASACRKSVASKRLAGASAPGPVARPSRMRVAASTTRGAVTA